MQKQNEYKLMHIFRSPNFRNYSEEFLQGNNHRSKEINSSSLRLVYVKMRKKPNSCAVSVASSTT